MKTRLSPPHAVVLLLSAFLFLSGCSTKKQPVFEQTYNDPYSFEAYLEKRERQAARSTMTQEERFAYDNRTASLAHMRHEGVPLSNLHLIEQAKTVLGTPYVPGGTSPEGFDCSGFVQWAYRNVGVRLPRTAREQSVMGRAIKSEAMKAGDIVAFNHPRRGYHTGIYLGDGTFIHSPGRGKSVSIAPLSDPYFQSTFIGARRIRTSESDAEAVKHLMAMNEHIRRDTPSVTNRRSATRKQVTERTTTRKKEAAPARQERKKETPVAVASRTKTTPPEKKQKTDQKATAQKASEQKTPEKKTQDKAPEKKTSEKKTSAPVKAAPTKEAPRTSPAPRQSVKATPAPQKKKDSEKKNAPAQKEQEKKVQEKKTPDKKAQEPQRAKPQNKPAQPTRKAPDTAPDKAKPAATRQAPAQPARTPEKAKPVAPKQAPAKNATPPKTPEKTQKQAPQKAAPAPKQPPQKQQPAKAPEKPKSTASKQAPAKNGTPQKTR